MQLDVNSALIYAVVLISVRVLTSVDNRAGREITDVLPVRLASMITAWLAPVLYICSVLYPDNKRLTTSRSATMRSLQSCSCWTRHIAGLSRNCAWSIDAHLRRFRARH